MTSETKKSGSIYAIGDIHGQLAELHRVLDLIEKDGGKDAQIVFLGDYTDRGTDSCGVIDRRFRLIENELLRDTRSLLI